MNTRKTLLVQKNYGEQPHYLLLNQDPEAENWEFPAVQGEDLENYLEENLGITEHKSDTEIPDRDVMSVKVPETVQPVINTEKYSGGLFLKKSDIKQLLDSENSLEAVKQLAG